MGALVFLVCSRRGHPVPDRADLVGHVLILAENVVTQPVNQVVKKTGRHFSGVDHAPVLQGDDVVEESLVTCDVLSGVMRIDAIFVHQVLFIGKMRSGVLEQLGKQRFEIARIDLVLADAFTQIVDQIDQATMLGIDRIEPGKKFAGPLEGDHVEVLARDRSSGRSVQESSIQLASRPRLSLIKWPLERGQTKRWGERQVKNHPG